MLLVDAIHAFNDNYIWLVTNPSYGNQCLVVDPGDPEVVEATLKQKQLELSGILITHHHYDHTGGIAELTRTRDIPVYGPVNPAISGITHPLQDGDNVTLLGTQFQVMSTPGHTLDHIVYFAQPEDRDPVLFCGDTLFSAGCGRLFEGSAQQMQLSLNRLNRLPKNTEVYCAHEYTLSNLMFAQAVEPDNADIKQRIHEVEALRSNSQRSIPSRIALEQKINPFLRTTTPEVIQAALARSGESSLNEDEVLGVIRQWKDNFQ